MNSETQERIDQIDYSLTIIKQWAMRAESNTTGFALLKQFELLEYDKRILQHDWRN